MHPRLAVQEVGPVDRLANPQKKLYTFLYGNVLWMYASAATTSDAFNAVAEPRRREILNFLMLQDRPVGDIVAALGMEQPSVSKHLRVLRDVGLVHVRRDGRQKYFIAPMRRPSGPFTSGQ